MGIIEALDESVSDRVSYGLVAMAFLEIKPGSGQSIFDVVDDPRMRSELLFLNGLNVFGQIALHEGMEFVAHAWIPVH